MNACRMKHTFSTTLLLLLLAEVKCIAFPSPSQVMPEVYLIKRCRVSARPENSECTWHVAYFELEPFLVQFTFHVSKQEIWQQGLQFSAEHIRIKTGLRAKEVDLIWSITGVPPHELTTLLLGLSPGCCAVQFIVFEWHVTIVNIYSINTEVSQ